MQSSPNMLTKFESKSSRAKGIAFHPKRPWILVSLHSSTIQLWDYRMGTLIDRFEEHDGPVRGIDFHKTQPLFVSGGDDYKIKVWSYQSRRCLFTLNGHLDYVRTVFFHHELPWILSSSDDQTIRIWNWQNRSLICTMTGHNHYTMCAQFHPKDDLIVSASLDQSVRVWDISGLRKKHSAPTSMTFEDQMARANSNQADMFGNTDAVVKFVLEGHDRGVNWVAFHPTLPLIVSSGDDRLVKLWRMSETKAWEVDTCRGHFQNSSACLFHPHQDLILSVGEDKTIRVWDLNKRTSVQSFKRESDRFWVIAAHPQINLFAAGHDNGVMVFKLERERPASANYQNQLFYITKEKFIRSYDFSKNAESPAVLSLRKFGSPWIPPRTLSYNPAERAVLVTSPIDNGTYELIHLPRDASGAIEPVEFKKGQGNSAIFVARNRFAVFTQSNQQVDIKDLTNSTTKSIKPPPGTTDIFFGGTGCILMATATSVALYDIQQKKQLADLAVAGVKYVVWSSDGLYAALLSKHNVTIVTKSLEQISTLHETIRIKSAAWDDAGVLLYSTLNHIKYTLLNGDNGIVRTLDQTVYLVRVKARSVYCLDRASKPKVLDVDPTEYRFKLALVKRNYEEMLQIIKTSSLVGQSIISYLQKKGYPEIALQFVQDPQTRFELAIECGNLDVAVEMAKQLDRPKLWTRLGTEALAHGNHTIVEMTYQKLRQFDKLSFLYLTTGDGEKLARMAKIAEHRGDFQSRFQNALYMGDVEARVQMLQELDLYPLAYATAKAAGLEDECQTMLEASGLIEDQISLPTMGKPLQPPKPIVHTHKANWPVKAASHSFFEKALLGEVGAVDDDIPQTSNGFDHTGGIPEDEAVTQDGQLGEEEDEDAAGWDMGDEINVEVESDSLNVDSADSGAGSSEADLWARNSPIAADHVAAGSFETAMQLLNRQVGAVKFEPLKPRFLEIYQASKTYLPATPGLPPLVNYVRRNGEETDSRKLLPIIPRDLESIASADLQEGYSAMRSNKLDDGLKTFKRILHSLLVNAVGSQQDVAEAKKIITTAAEYATAMALELERRALPTEGEDNLKRSLELSAYFTIPKLEVAHRQLALMAAMKLAFTNKNYSSALSFANRMLANGGSAKLLDQAKKIKSQCERSPQDKVDIEFDQFAEFDVCASSYTPIYGGSPSVACPFDGAKYHSEFKGQVCRVCEVCEIGAPASGIRVDFEKLRFAQEDEKTALAVEEGRSEGAAKTQPETLHQTPGSDSPATMSKVEAQVGSILQQVAQEASKAAEEPNGFNISEEKNTPNPSTNSIPKIPEQDLQQLPEDYSSIAPTLETPTTSLAAIAGETAMEGDACYGINPFPDLEEGQQPLDDNAWIGATIGGGSFGGSQHNEASSVVGTEQHQIQAFAKLEFDDGEFYMNTYAVEIGRDLHAARQAAEFRARQDTEKQSASSCGSITSSKVKYRNGQNVASSIASESEPTRQPKPRKPKSWSSSSQQLSRKSSMLLSNGKTDYNALAMASLMGHGSGANVFSPNGLMPAPELVPLVPIHLPALPEGAPSGGKSISRKHIRIAYNFEEGVFEVRVLGRNGGFVDDEWYAQGDVQTLMNGSIIQIGGVGIRFVLPDVAPGETGAETGLGSDPLSGGKMSFDMAESIEDESDDDVDESEERGRTREIKNEEEDEEDEEEKEEEGEEEPEMVKARAKGKKRSEPEPSPTTKRKGPGRPPKNGIISKREQALLARQAREDAKVAKSSSAALPSRGKVKAGQDTNAVEQEEPPQQRNGKRKYTKRKRAGGTDNQRDGRESTEQTDSVPPEQSIATVLPPKPAKEKKPPKPPRSPSPVFDESKLTPEQLTKPPQNYIALIHEALSNSETGAMALPQIYRSLQRRYPYFKLRATTPGWQSSVRHNLGQNAAFRKIERDGKGWMWGLVPGVSIEKEKKRRATPPPVSQQPYYPPAPPPYPQSYPGMPPPNGRMPPNPYNMHPGMPPARMPHGLPPRGPHGFPLPLVNAQSESTYQSPYQSTPPPQQSSAPAPHLQQNSNTNGANGHYPTPSSQPLVQAYDNNHQTLGPAPSPLPAPYQSNSIALNGSLGESTSNTHGQKVDQAIARYKSDFIDSMPDKAKAESLVTSAINRTLGVSTDEAKDEQEKTIMSEIAQMLNDLSKKPMGSQHQASNGIPPPLKSSAAPMYDDAASSLPTAASKAAEIPEKSVPVNGNAHRQNGTVDNEVPKDEGSGKRPFENGDSDGITEHNQPEAKRQAIGV